METFELVIDGIKCDAIKIEHSSTGFIRIEIVLVYNKSLNRHIHDKIKAEGKPMIVIHPLPLSILAIYGYLDELTVNEDNNTMSMILTRPLTDEEREDRESGDGMC